MEIVIENPGGTSPTNPGMVVHPHLHRPCRSIYGTDLASPGVNYYATLPPRLRSHHLVPGSDLDGASTTTSVRRVDRSGLLEIPELEPPRARPRHLNGAESLGHSGTLSRRIDRSGLLEVVPEVPDQCQGNCSADEISSMSEGSRSRPIIDRHLTGAEINKQSSNLSPRLTRSPVEPGKRRSFESISSIEEVNSVPGGSSPTVSSNSCGWYQSPKPGSRPRTSPMVGTCSEIRTPSTKFMPIEVPSRDAQSSDVDSNVVKEGYDKQRRTSVNSPLNLSRPCSRNSIDNPGEAQDSKEKKPDCLGRISPRLRSDRPSPMTLSSIPDVIEAHGSASTGRNLQRNSTPEGERAEAEGCEHTAIESLEETRVAFKTPNKILHNDNIQAVHVFILSEQL